MTGRAYRINEVIHDAAAMRELPVGTVVKAIEGNNDTWTKDAEGMWFHPNGGRWGERDFAMGQHMIFSFPSGSDTFVAPFKTVEQVKWEYRNGALAAANSHGVSVRAVEESLSRMGAGANDFRDMLGSGVIVGDATIRDQLPNGSVIFNGSPAVPNSLAVFVKKNGRWEHILGERNFLDGSVTIDSVAGKRERPEWLDREGSEEDEEAIREFKATAWRVGYDLKREMGWCGTYEDIVRRLGVTEQAVRVAQHGGFTLGMRVHFDAANSLPVGTVLGWQHSERPERWAVFLRSSRASNRAMTIRVAASPEQADADHEQQKRYMTILGLPDRTTGVAEWDLPAHMDDQFLLVFPPGTRFTYGGNNGTFIIAADHTAANDSTVVPARGTWARQAFGTIPHYTVRSIPGV